MDRPPPHPDQGRTHCKKTHWSGSERKNRRCRIHDRIFVCLQSCTARYKDSYNKQCRIASRQITDHELDTYFLPAPTPGFFCSEYVVNPDEEAVHESEKPESQIDVIWRKNSRLMLEGRMLVWRRTDADAQTGRRPCCSFAP